MSYANRKWDGPFFRLPQKYLNKKNRIHNGLAQRKSRYISSPCVVLLDDEFESVKEYGIDKEIDRAYDDLFYNEGLTW